MHMLLSSMTPGDSAPVSQHGPVSACVIAAVTPDHFKPISPCSAIFFKRKKKPRLEMSCST